MISKPSSNIASKISAAFFGFAAMVLCAQPSLAQPSIPEGALVKAELLLDHDIATQGQQIFAAVKLTITPDWHTYWANPGDSGLPTKVTWQDLPAGFVAGDIQWSTPSKHVYPPITNFGYDDVVYHLIPLTVSGNAPLGSTQTLKAKVTWLVCNDVCIPEGAEVSAEVRIADTAVPSRYFEDIAAVQNALPQVLDAQGSFQINAANQFEVQLPLNAFPEQAMALLQTSLAQNQTDTFELFPYNATLMDNNAPVTATVTDGQLVFEATPESSLKLRISRTPEKLVTDAAGKSVPAEFLLVLKDSAGKKTGYRFQANLNTTAQTVKEGAVSPSISPTANTPTSPNSANEPPTTAITATSTISVWTAIGLALLGGIILNLMPCVFPVLFLKAASFINHSAESRGQVIASALAYTTGILATFAALAGILIALRAAGAQIGWGFQFQSPVVVLLLALFLLGFAISLSGGFSFGTSFMGVGQGLTQKEGLSGSFFTGALAVVVATPCTGPFMGTALGFALTQSWYVTLAVFLSLGLGLGLPYLAISLSPTLLKLLPKPGIWMEKFKHILAWPLYAFSAFLVCTLVNQAGIAGIYAAMTGAVLVAGGAILYQISHISTGNFRKLGNFFATLMFVFALATPVIFRLHTADSSGSLSKTPTETTVGSLSIQPFSIEALEAAREAGQPVFVELTASWCITCKVNEHTTLNKPEVAAALNTANVLYLRGDWTNMNAEITDYMASYNRSGVPMYIYYPPLPEEMRGKTPHFQHSGHVILPQILTTGIITDTLKSVSSSL